jgi:hypothetical protein
MVIVICKRFFFISFSANKYNLVFPLVVHKLKTFSVALSIKIEYREI